METEGVEKGKGKKTEQVDNFLQEIASICRKHGFSISHEDTHLHSDGVSPELKLAVAEILG